jgi:hypothetical protein
MTDGGLKGTCLPGWGQRLLRGLSVSDVHPAWEDSLQRDRGRSRRSIAAACSIAESLSPEGRTA